MPVELAALLLAIAYAAFAVSYAKFQNRRLHREQPNRHPAE